MTLEYTRRLGALEPEPPDPDAALEAPDRRDGRVYLLPEDLRLAVEVAMTTGRPLLLRGEPGSGKSSLAPFLARNLDYRYYEKTITSATRAQDLLWHFDAVRRLSDAQVKERKANEEYVEPGVLWWAFNADSARRRGLEAGQEPESPATEPNATLNAGRQADRAVVLIDEIDKADPDVPNGLLEPLSASTFVVQDTNAIVQRSSQPHDDELSHLLVVITTNEERDLPPAFVRRCIVFTLAHPMPDRLVEIARMHHRANDPPFDETLCGELADRVETMRDEADAAGVKPPGTAEYLDAVRACAALEISPGDSRAWQVLASATLAKERKPKQ